MKKGLLAYCLLFFSATIFAQNAKIEGTIKDEKGEGLIQANVIIDAAKGQATVSDFDGNYELSVPAGTYTVTYRYIGKEDVIVKITLKEGDVVTKNISLKEKERLMDQVVVTGSKYGKKLSEETISMDVLNNTTLNNQNITDLQNGMQKVPGVTIADGQAQIRGGAGWSYGAGTRVSVLYDDLPVTTADADDAKWSMIPMENVDQVEIIKGAASALYGSGALNGVINARMAYAKDKPVTKVTSYVGFYDSPTKTRELKWWTGAPQWMAGVNLADRRKIGQWDLVFGAAYNNDRGYLSGGQVPTTIKTASGTDSIVIPGTESGAGGQDGRLNAKIRYRFKNKLEGLNVGINLLGYWSWGTTFFLWNGTGNQGYRPFPGTVTKYDNGRYIIDPFINYFDTKGNNISLKYRLLNSSNINSTGQGSIANRHIIDLSYSRPFEVSNKISLNFLAGVGGRIDKVRPPDNPNDTFTGVNRQNIIDSIGYIPNPYLYGDKGHDAYNASVFAQVDAKFFNRLTVSLGARWEYFNVDGANSLKDLTYPLFRLGVNYQAHKATYIRGSFGQGFRYPSIAERFVTTSLGPIGIYANPKLKPEKGFSAELGLKQGFELGKKSGWVGFVDLSAFWNQYQNMMEFTFGPFGGPGSVSFGAGFSSQNIGNTRILGSEGLIGVEGKVKGLTINIAAGYTFIDAKSLNWNDRLILFDSKGDTVKPNFNSAYNNANAPANIDTSLLEAYTYGMTSSSSKNFLKYRPRHQFKLIFNLDHKFFDFNLDYQYIGFQENIDYAFISGLFSTLGGSAFSGLTEYRANQIANGSKGNHILNIGLGFKPVEKFKIQFIVKNALNEEWMTRPGQFQAPRSYTLQLSYKF
jgi:outer membrane receptor protein involved in Fe transport